MSENVPGIVWFSGGCRGVGAVESGRDGAVIKTKKAAPILGTAGFSRKMIGPVIIPPRRATERSVLRAYPRVDCTHDNWRLSRAVVRVSRLSHSSRFAGVVSGWTHASSSSYDAILLLARPRRSRSLGHHGQDLRHAVRDLRLPSNDPDSGACC